MEFIVEYTDKIHIGDPIYINKEESFSYDPWLKCDFSIMIGKGYNSLNVDLTSGVVVHMSGLNSNFIWKLGIVQPPNARNGLLKIKITDSMIPGIGITYADDWNTVYDRQSGWIQIGDCCQIRETQFVTFAHETIAAIKRGKLKAIWIKPKMIDLN